ncbi:serine hydrolase [Leuconostoc citreum]|nr:serine hydrolase [Leuconostoc citreum]
MNKKIWLSSLIAVLVVLAVVTTIFYYLPQWQRAREGSTKTTQQAKNKSIEPAKQPETLSTVTADTNLDRYISELGFSGSVLVVKDNKVILRKGYGEANYEQKIPNSPNTLFPIGSTQKAMIATAILQLQEK